jgi:hypothetical protein
MIRSCTVRFRGPARGRSGVHPPYFIVARLENDRSVPTQYVMWVLDSRVFEKLPSSLAVRIRQVLVGSFPSIQIRRTRPFVFVLVSAVCAKTAPVTDDPCSKKSTPFPGMCRIRISEYLLAPLSPPPGSFTLDSHRTVPSVTAVSSTSSKAFPRESFVTRSSTRRNAPGSIR